MVSTISVNWKAFPLKLSLQGLPPEIRNMIYRYRLVAENPMRAILICRLMKTHVISGRQIDLPSLLKHSTTLDPLAQTCREFLREYQPLYLNIAGPEYVLIINNFDVGQIEYAARFICRYCHVTTQRVTMQGAHPELSPFEVVVRPFGITKAFFYLNNNAVNSAQALLDHIKRYDDLPIGLTALDGYRIYNYADHQHTIAGESARPTTRAQKHDLPTPCSHRRLYRLRQAVR